MVAWSRKRESFHDSWQQPPRLSASSRLSLRDDVICRQADSQTQWEAGTNQLDEHLTFRYSRFKGHPGGDIVLAVTCMFVGTGWSSSFLLGGRYGRIILAAETRNCVTSIPNCK